MITTCYLHYLARSSGESPWKHLYLHYHDYFLLHNRELGEDEPIWINEMDYATTGGHKQQFAHLFQRVDG